MRMWESDRKPYVLQAKKRDPSHFRKTNENCSCPCGLIVNVFYLYKKNEFSALIIKQKGKIGCSRLSKKWKRSRMPLGKIPKERKDKLNLSDEAVGKIAFSFMTGKRTKIQAIFVGQGAGQYRNKQKLRLPDIMNLSEALGMNIQEVIKAALKKML